MKKQCILSAAFIVSLMPMLLNQYGRLRDVSEVSGVINLLSPNAFPIGTIAVVLFLFTLAIYCEKTIGSFCFSLIIRVAH